MARSVWLSDAEILGVYKESESVEAGTGWVAITEAAALLVGRKDQAEVADRQQVQRGIERMQAVVTAPRAAQTDNLHRAGGRFGVAIVLAPRRALDTHWRPRPDRQPVPGLRWS